MNSNLTTIATDLTTPQVRPAQRDYVLLDASGSMSIRWIESLDAIDKYVGGLQTDDVESRVTVTGFSTAGNEPTFVIYRDCKPLEWTDLLLDTPPCIGSSTPLYDAINMMTRELRDENPERCSILIVTDGDENASRCTDVTQAKAMLDWCRAKGWQVTFVGCDFNNARQAKLLGGDESSAIGVHSKRLTDATTELARKRARYAKFGTPMHFTEADRQNFGGYLGYEGGK